MVSFLMSIKESMSTTASKHHLKHILKTMKMLYFLLLLFIGSFDVTSASCDCQPSSRIDLHQLQNSGTLNKLITDKLGDSSKQICVGYSTWYFWSRYLTYFPNQAIQNAEVKNSCGPKKSDGSINCQIESTSFALKKCYPKKQFCIHQVVCPSTHRASIQCSSLDLPKASDGKCLDSLFITSGILHKKQYCGTTKDCFPGFVEAGGSRIRIVFTGGKCCQRCGYRIWVSCVPQPSNTGMKGTEGIKGVRGPAKRDIEEHEIEERGARGPPGPRPPTKVVVPTGAVLTYKNRSLTVKLGTTTLQSRWTSKLQVKDDIAYGPVLFEATTTANRSFVGYGIMTIYSDRIHYHQQGVPPNERPNATEKEFINNVTAYLNFHVPSGGSPGKRGAPGQKGAPASSCHCEDNAGPPGPLPPDFYYLAKYYAEESPKPIVAFWGARYVENNVEPTTSSPPSTSGTKVPPGVPGPVGPSGPAGSF